ncbi:ADP-ribosylation factor-like protein 9 [Cololabis saira]|uniref:ADP-ribosylation factor-like protein 9 n=1 Tax=Cololabis saira TaxID=129043 RepID=UPI002AD340EE|nr:ADP-ribosylation factor-like protein 9 [Cololabis saira]
MFGLREAGVVGASAALAGAVAYLIWNYVSSPGQNKPDTRHTADRDRNSSGIKERISEEVVSALEQKPAGASPVEAAGTQILVLGLDGAGKTSLLHCFSIGNPEQDMQPTQGFNAVSISKDNLHIEFLEIGGKEDLRAYWQRYMSKALLLVFVVDSADPERFPVAKKHLHEVLASRPSLPLMVLANKQDLPGSCGITDLHEALSLSEVGHRRLFLIGTYVRKGDAELCSGVQDAHDMIVQMVCDGR